jgi:hypothetical protein
VGLLTCESPCRHERSRRGSSTGDHAGGDRKRLWLGQAACSACSSVTCSRAFRAGVAGAGRGARVSSACVASRGRARGTGPGRGRCGSRRRGCRGGSRRSLWPRHGGRGAVRDGRRDRCLWSVRRPSRTRSAPRSATSVRGGSGRTSGGRLTRDCRGRCLPRTRGARPSGTRSCPGRIRRSAPARFGPRPPGSCTATRNRKAARRAPPFPSSIRQRDAPYWVGQRVLVLHACRSLGRCFTGTACSWPPGRPTAAKHAGRRISPLFLAHSGDVLDQRRELARAQAALSRAERRFLPRGP